MEKMKGKIKFDYDSESDVLYSYVDHPRKAESLDVDDGVVVRVDPKTNKAVGFTIIDFQRRMKKGLLKKIPYFENIDLTQLSFR